MNLTTIIIACAVSLILGIILGWQAWKAVVGSDNESIMSNLAYVNATQRESYQKLLEENKELLNTVGETLASEKRAWELNKRLTDKIEDITSPKPKLSLDNGIGNVVKSVEEFKLKEEEKSKEEPKEKTQSLIDQYGLRKQYEALTSEDKEAFLIDFKEAFNL